MASIAAGLGLTPDELNELMTSSWNMRVATLGPGDRINLTPLWFGWAGGNVYFYCRGQKIANLRRTPTCSVLVDRNERFPDLQGAMMQGTAVVLEAAADEAADPHLSAAQAQMGPKYAGGHGEPAPASTDGLVFGPTARGRSWRWVVFTPTHVVTWDNKKLPAEPERPSNMNGDTPMSEPTFDTILLTIDGAIARLTLNRPDRMNGMTNRMVRETADALDFVATDPAVRVLVLTGAGRSFCPGADLQAVASGTVADERLGPAQFRAPVLLHEMPAVTVAVINGACAGAGLGWAAACDLRVATRSARFNTAFLDVAVAGDMALPWSLPRLLGAGKARELCMMPGKFDADEAHRIGFVARVFDDAQFADEAEAVVQRLAGAAPAALRTMKGNFLDAERMDLAQFIVVESERHLGLFTLDDTREAFAAKVEGRAPRFTGH